MATTDEDLGEISPKECKRLGTGSHCVAPYLHLDLKTTCNFPASSFGATQSPVPSPAPTTAPTASPTAAPTEVEFAVNVDVEASLDISADESLSALPAEKQAAVREAAVEIAAALVAESGRLWPSAADS